MAKLNQKLIKRVIKNKGYPFIVHKAVEEMAELTQALSKMQIMLAGDESYLKETSEIMELVHEEVSHAEIFIEMLKCKLDKDKLTDYRDERVNRIEYKYT